MTYPRDLVAACMRQRAQELRARAAKARERSSGCTAAASHERNASSYRADMAAADNLRRKAQDLDAGAAYLEAQAALIPTETEHA
jgi:hypothetical protein